MNRRSLFALPLLAVFPVPAHAHPVSELRFGGPDPAAGARAIQAHLGVPTRPVRLAGAALAHALNAGHLEAACLDPTAMVLAQSLMGPRLTCLGNGLVTRTVLSPALKGDITAALTA